MAWVPTTGLLDDFNGGAEDPIVTDWSTPTLFGSGSLKIAGDVLVVSSTVSEAYYDVETFGPDTEVYADVVSLVNSGSTMHVVARITDPNSSGNTNGYSAAIKRQDGDDNTRLFVITGDGFTQMGSQGTQEWSAGDKLGMTVIADTIKMYRHNGSVWSDAIRDEDNSDSGHQGAGYIGLNIADSSGSMDNFSGGTVVYTPLSTLGLGGTSRHVRPAFTYPSGQTGSGTLAAQSAIIAGVGVTESVGAGTPAAQSASVTGAGVSESIGAGTPAAQSAIVAGVGVAKWVGSGTPAAQSAIIAGVGVTESVGSGTPAAQSATVSGAGVSESVGAGTLAAQSASVAGVGSGGQPTGTGALDAQSATVAGVGVSESVGAGTPAAQSASVTGAGVSESVGSGTPAAQSAIIAGVGVVKYVGSGTLDAQSAIIAGVGVSESVGAGVLVAQSALVSGYDVIAGIQWNPYTNRPGADSGVAIQTRPV